MAGTTAGAAGVKGSSRPRCRRRPSFENSPQIIQSMQADHVPLMSWQTRSPTSKRSREMIIKLENTNNSGTMTMFVGSRSRQASATSVVLLDPRRLLACSLVGKRMYLIEFDVARGTHKVLSSVTTQFAGHPMMTDLMDYDGREFIVTSDCGKCAVSLYRLAGDQLSFVKDIAIAPPDTAFCHGARFVPPGDFICATFSTGCQVYFVSKTTGEIIYQFTDGKWLPKDAGFISLTKMVVVFASATATPGARASYDSKVSLISLDLAAKRHHIISEIETKDCHADSCRYADGRVYVNNQMRDSLLVFRIENDQLVFDREHFGYDFPHGVDVLPSANLLAVTNFGSNSISLGPIPPAGLPVLKSSRVLAAPENVGPYRLLQEIVNRADYDAFLLQDADDWSTPDRLALLLAEAEKTGAEIVGSQFDDVTDDHRQPFPLRPRNASAAYAADPTGHFVCFGASLISRELLLRLGGLANGLRFSGDAELFRRAYHIARLANIPETCYFRRKHPDSLTQRPETGMQSPARTQLDDSLKTRALENAAAIAAGRAPDLKPFSIAPPVALEHITGPQLCATATQAGAKRTPDAHIRTGQEPKP